MPFHAGNRLGKKNWFKSPHNEPTIQVGVRIPVSHIEAIDSHLEPLQSRSDWIREAIVKRLESEGLLSFRED